MIFNFNHTKIDWLKQEKINIDVIKRSDGSRRKWGKQHKLSSAVETCRLSQWQVMV